ncbi:hypothetical protein LPY66_08595 [Dehalobacter sp. DCM]|uniref:hypothetical protein n=1 Tax=Dehalobacter sp. DCM TaxID=2907827 RepID=UPI0030813A9E|nr:hypothetical protein LPY66_08595 [Dehalobacter sp. DCM]
MNTFQKIAFLACRIISVFLLAKWLGAFSNSVITLFAMPSEGPHLTYYVVASAIPLIIGVLIWIFADKLAGWMTGSTKQEEFPLTFDLDTAQIIVLTTAGLIMLANAIPSLISAATAYKIIMQGLPASSWQIVSGLVDAAVRIIMGVCLTFGSHGIWNIIKKLRTFGT